MRNENEENKDKSSADPALTKWAQHKNFEHLFDPKNGISEMEREQNTKTKQKNEKKPNGEENCWN